MSQVKGSPAQQRLNKSAYRAYREEFHSEGVIYFVVVEIIITCFRFLPGALGLLLRRIFYPYILSYSCKPIIGAFVSIKKGRQIRLGKLVALDEFSSIEAKKAGTISIGDNVVIGKFTSVVAKDCDVKIGAGSNIGSHSRLASESGISIGEGVLIASFCYIGPGNHLPDAEGNYVSGDMELKGGVHIEDNCWIASHVIILDGVRIGRGSIIGANSFVTKDVPPYSVVVGTPGRVVKNLSIPNRGS